MSNLSQIYKVCF